MKTKFEYREHTQVLGSWDIFSTITEPKNRERVSLKKLAAKYSHFSDLWVYLRDHDSIINAEKW